jgi:hypothetical protein
MPDLRDVKSDDTYIQSLHKLLPAELTAVYFALRAAAADNTNLTIWLLGFAAVLALIFYFIAPRLLDISRPIDRIVYCITFAFWVVSIEAGNIASVLLNLGADATAVFLFAVSGIALIWSFVTPYLVLTTAKSS